MSSHNYAMTDWLNYFLTPPDGSRSYSKINSDSTGGPCQNWADESHIVDIENVREPEDQYKLDEAGFQFGREHSTHSHFLDDKEIEAARAIMVTLCSFVIRLPRVTVFDVHRVHVKFDVSDTLARSKRNILMLECPYRLISSASHQLPSAFAMSSSSVSIQTIDAGLPDGWTNKMGHTLTGTVTGTQFPSASVISSSSPIKGVGGAGPPYGWTDNNIDWDFYWGDEPGKLKNALKTDYGLSDAKPIWTSEGKYGNILFIFEATPSSGKLSYYVWDGISRSVYHIKAWDIHEIRDKMKEHGEGKSDLDGLDGLEMEVMP